MYLGIQWNLCIVVTGHSVKQPPQYYSHLLRSLVIQRPIFEPLLNSYLSITATDLWPIGDHYREVSLYYISTPTPIPERFPHVHNVHVHVHYTFVLHVHVCVHIETLLSRWPHTQCTCILQTNRQHAFFHNRRCLCACIIHKHPAFISFHVHVCTMQKQL